jgi:bacterial translation initiation factor 2 (bIF-2)
MSVKNGGSKLAEACAKSSQQDNAPTNAVADAAPIAAAVKAALPSPAVKPVAAKPVAPKLAPAKPAPAKDSNSGMQHPDRVWPD